MKQIIIAGMRKCGTTYLEEYYKKLGYTIVNKDTDILIENIEKLQRALYGDIKVVIIYRKDKLKQIDSYEAHQKRQFNRLTEKEIREDLDYKKRYKKYNSIFTNVKLVCLEDLNDNNKINARPSFKNWKNRDFLRMITPLPILSIYQVFKTKMMFMNIKNEIKSKIGGGAE